MLEQRLAIEEDQRQLSSKRGKLGILTLIEDDDLKKPKDTPVNASTPNCSNADKIMRK